MAGEAVFAELTDHLERDTEPNVSKPGAALGMRADVKMPAKLSQSQYSSLTLEQGSL